MKGPIKKPSVVIEHGKNDPRYFYVRDNDDLNRVALALLKGRHDAGWYSEPQLKDYLWGLDAPDVVGLLKLSKEEVDALPEAIRASASEKYTELKQREARAKREFKKDSTWYTEMLDLTSMPVSRALMKTNHQGHPLAWLLIWLRTEGEYENVSIESFEEVTL